MGHHCCSKQKVKRGLWSPEEDEKLIKCITTHGHGCWSSVPKLAGLQRCGKSCRLRWINYLRPDLKRGSFSAQEERVIIDVHRILGNRWAQIAKHLPGRTDNEVKNFWNSCIKKKLIAQGLDPRTHNLIPNSHHHHLTNSSSTNACNNDNPNPHHQLFQQLPLKFSINNNNNNPSFLTMPTTTTLTHDTSPLHEALTNQNPNPNPNPNWVSSVKDHDQTSQAQLMIDFSSSSSTRSSIDSTISTNNVKSSSSMNNPSGFGALDDQNGFYHSFDDDVHQLNRHEDLVDQPLQQQQQQQQMMMRELMEFNINVEEKNIINGSDHDQCIHRDDSSLTSNFDLDFMEFTMMPCEMYSHIDHQLAWSYINSR
ncbi:hypothetical protein Sjap_003680 [Stephania japonica]|uniref:Uncharacterized protein n=2 Tax=Mesangiospermae TaxID=1437183 RepID=A0AAP0KQ73_9MAGN